MRITMLCGLLLLCGCAGAAPYAPGRVYTRWEAEQQRRELALIAAAEIYSRMPQPGVTECDGRQDPRCATP